MVAESTALARRDLLAGLLIAGLVIVLYGYSCLNGFVYDDHDLILEQPPCESVNELFAVFHETHPHHGSRSPYYRPIALMTYRAQKFVHGDEPLPFHAFNVILATLIAISFYSLLRTKTFSIPPALAVLSTTLFVSHPAMSSCVYAIANRETLLPLLFSLVCLVCFLHGGKVGWTLTICFVLVALLCKEQAIILPPALILCDLLKLPSQRTEGRTRVVFYLALILTVGLYFGIRNSVVGGVTPEIALTLDPYGPLWSLLYTLQTIAAPFMDLTYEPPRNVWWEKNRLVFAGGFALALGIAALIHRTRLWRTNLFLVGLFLLGILPTANVLKQETMFAERYVVTSLACAIVLTTALLAIHWEKAGFRIACVTALAVASILACYVTWNRAAHFSNDIAFGRQWISVNPQSLNAHKLLGRSYLEQDIPDGALYHFQRALDIDDFHADAHYFTGMLLRRSGDSQTAAMHLKRSSELDANEPATWFQRATLELESNRTSEAIEHLKKTVSLAPQLVEAQMLLGNLLASDGHVTEAAFHFKRAVDYSPNMPEAHNNLGNALLQLGRFREARIHVELAISLEPGYSTAHYNLAQVLAGLRNRTGAIAELLTCIRISADWKNDLDLITQLADLYEQSGQPDKAIEWLEQAVALAAKQDPDRVTELQTQLDELKRSDP